MSMEDTEMTYDECKEMVRGPGKFEACPVYAPYYYDAMLDGCPDDTAGDDLMTDMFIVSADDRAMFPELDATDECVTISVDYNGFVTCNTCTQAEWYHFAESFMDQDDVDYRNGR
jgi:hypothetical protein